MINSAVKWEGSQSKTRWSKLDWRLLFRFKPVILIAVRTMGVDFVCSFPNQAVMQNLIVLSRVAG